LRILARDVEKGKINALAQLDKIFAATQRAIARLHCEKAKEAYATGALRAAGAELQAAKESLGRAAVWTGDHVYPPLMQCLDRAEEDGKRLMEGADASPHFTKHTLAALGAQIDRLDKKAELDDARDKFSGETEFYLKEARRKFEARDRQGAAEDIGRARGCMGVETFTALEEAKVILDKEIVALEKTAEEVKNGSLTSLGRLERRFSSAQYALARAHHIRASRYDSQHYYKRAVAALAAAVTDLERAVAWTGKGMKNSAARVVKDVRDMSKRMREGLSVKPEEISAAVSDLKKVLERQSALSASP
jgi:hypothetical protein